MSRRAGALQIGAMRQPAVVRGIVVYKDTEGETAHVPTGPCELDYKGGGGARLTRNNVYGKPCHCDLSEAQLAYYIESKALVVDVQPTMI